MKTITDIINEKLTISQSREYMAVKRDPKAQAWLDAFWERLKEYKDATVSHNGYRIYIPFKIDKFELELSDQQGAYNNPSVVLRNRIKNYIEHDKGIDIVEFDYLHGKFYVEQETQRGTKRREMNIGKFIKDNKELLTAYSADPIRNIGNLERKDLSIVLSNHSYDIAGMSTDRQWTSCMNIIDGLSRNWVKEDIKWGSVVAYLIESIDTNIGHPLGRILIKPYLNDDETVCYFPEPTVYSPYVGLDSMKKFLDDICLKIQGEITNLHKLARDLNDPNQQPFPRIEEIVDLADITDEDRLFFKKFKDEIKKNTLEQEKKYNFLLYYDDYFGKQNLKFK